MEIHNSMEALGSLLGVQETAPRGAGRGQGTPGLGPLSTDQASFSSAASQVAQAAGEEDVRTGKVASIQAALAAGSYDVPATAVASRLVDSMLAAGR